jgi:pimeloyl-ACP methyl ester carboxylesterase
MITQFRSFPSIANKTIKLFHINIAYKDEGVGQILLCLHALGHSSTDFLSLYELPLNKFRVICVDFPGHGNSSSPKEDVSSSYFAKIIIEFIEQLDLKNIAIIGNSIGGAVALRIAADNSKIKMLSLSNPAGLDKRGLFAPFFIDSMIRFFQLGVDNNIKFQKKFKDYYSKVLTSNQAVCRRDEIIADGYRLAPLLLQGWKSFKLQSEDLRPLVKLITCPVLFTWGTNDKFVQLNRNQKAIEQFKNYKLIKYEIGHTPYIECPEVFLKDFEKFFELCKTYKNGSI